MQSQSNSNIRNPAGLGVQMKNMSKIEIFYNQQSSEITFAGLHSSPVTVSTF